MLIEHFISALSAMEKRKFPDLRQRLPFVPWTKFKKVRLFGISYESVR